MDEEQLASQMVESFLNMQVEENIGEISEYYSRNSEEIIKEFKESFRKLFLKGIALQVKGKGSIEYLTISVLRTFIMEKNYNLRLDLYDKSFFLDKIECSEYLNLDFIMKYIDKDLELILKELEACGVRYKEYKNDEFKKVYIDTYMDIIQEFLMNSINGIFEIEEYAQLQKTPDFKIIFGEYLDKTVTLFDNAVKGGEK